MSDDREMPGCLPGGISHAARVSAAVWDSGLPLRHYNYCDLLAEVGKDVIEQILVNLECRDGKVSCITHPFSGNPGHSNVRPEGQAAVLRFYSLLLQHPSPFC